ncbi:MAG: sigma-70 family RNA polymerase sigma factor [Acidobacteriota bacterium]
MESPVLGKDLYTRSTFAEATLQHLDALYGFAMTLSRNEGVAADLVQETYVHTLRSWEQFTPGTHLKSWMFIILRNIWLNQYRREKSGPQFVRIESENDEAQLSDGLVAQGDTPELSLLRTIKIKQVRMAIESLPDVYREVILLREMEGFSYREIAKIMQCAEGTIMSRLNRARLMLRNILAGVIK